MAAGPPKDPAPLLNGSKGGDIARREQTGRSCVVPTPRSVFTVGVGCLLGLASASLGSVLRSAAVGLATPSRAWSTRHRKRIDAEETP